MNSMTAVLVFALASLAIASPQFRTSFPGTVPRFPTQLPGESGNVVPILERDEVRDESGQFMLRYVTGDGITVNEVGRLVPNDEGDGSVLVKEGSYMFTTPEGKTYTVAYISDRNGFRPTGDHLPVSPIV